LLYVLYLITDQCKIKKYNGKKNAIFTIISQVFHLLCRSIINEITDGRIKLRKSLYMIFLSDNRELDETESNSCRIILLSYVSYCLFYV